MCLPPPSLMFHRCGSGLLATYNMNSFLESYFPVLFPVLFQFDVPLILISVSYSRSALMMSVILMAQHRPPLKLLSVLRDILPRGTTPHFSSCTICWLACLDLASFYKEGCFAGWFSGFRWVVPAVTGCQVDACFGLDCGGGGEVSFAQCSSANGHVSLCSDHHPLIGGLLSRRGCCLQWDSWNLVVGGGKSQRCRSCGSLRMAKYYQWDVKLYFIDFIQNFSSWTLCMLLTYIWKSCYPGMGHVMQTMSDHMHTMCGVTSRSISYHRHERWCVVMLLIGLISFAMSRGTTKAVDHGKQWGELIQMGPEC